MYWALRWWWCTDTGNPLKAGFFAEPCYNLVYLELAACRLMALPREFSRMVPNVRVLNLNYNFLEDAGPLEGLSRLRKLTIIGSRIKGAKQLIRTVRGMRDLEMIDFRCVASARFPIHPSIPAQTPARASRLGGPSREAPCADGVARLLPCMPCRPAVGSHLAPHRLCVRARPRRGRR